MSLRHFALFALAAFASMSAVAPVDAGTNVAPGTGTLQAAIDVAGPGATLVLHDGVYAGPVVIDKALKLICVGPSQCKIDAQCSANVTLDIQEQKVLVKGTGKAAFIVQGGLVTQIRIAAIKVQLKHLGAVYGATPCGDEQNGIEITGSSSIVKLSDVSSAGYPGAGLLLNGLPGYTAISVKRFVGVEDGVGILIQNSGAASKPGGSRIKIDKAVLAYNQFGVLMANSDGVRITHSILRGDGVDPEVGIALDASSDFALIKNCTWVNPDMMSTAFMDAGMGTCGSKNAGLAVPSCN
jgi:nitrous oxidase accessory protein NosD